MHEDHIEYNCHECGTPITQQHNGYCDDCREDGEDLENLLERSLL